MEEKNDILENQLKILEEIASLKKDFNSKIKYDQHKEKIIDKLHEELQLYKSDLYKKLLLPMINDLIHFIGRAEKDFDFLKNFSKEEIIQRMYDFTDDLRDVLYRQGVESYKTENDDFDPKRQKIIKTIETNDKNLDKKVANHRSYGYEWEGKIIKPENVDVYVFKEPEETDKESKSKNLTEENLQDLQNNEQKKENLNNNKEENFNQEANNE